MIAKRWLNYLKDHNHRFEEWQKRNPSTLFKDFYAERVERKLRKGAVHRPIGGSLFNRKSGTSGHGFILKLMDLGLKPDHTCVDYGCGTLRLGVHALNYLRPRLIGAWIYQASCWKKAAG